MSGMGLQAAAGANEPSLAVRSGNSAPLEPAGDSAARRGRQARLSNARVVHEAWRSLSVPMPARVPSRTT